MTSAAPAPSGHAPESLPAPLVGIASLILHCLFLLLLWIPAGSLAISGGEGGDRGAGGPVVEIRVIGAQGEQPLIGPGAPAAGSPPPEAPPAVETVAPAAEPALEVASSIVVPPPRASERALAAPATAAQPDPEGSALSREDAEPGETGESPVALVSGSGTGAQSESSGRSAGDERAAAAILGSVGLVPGAAVRGVMADALRCPDEIEGRWTAHRYRPGARDWVRMELRIERDGDELRGEIRARTWAGMTTDRVPPPCVPGGRDVTMRMEATGSFRGRRLDFGSRRAELLRADCPDRSHIYYPDHFTGTLAPDGETLNTTNNDGHVDIDFPYRFHRVSCTTQ